VWSVQRTINADRSLYRLYLKLKKLVKRQQWVDFWDAINDLTSKADIYVVGVPIEVISLEYDKRSDAVEELEVVILSRGVKTRIWMENLKHKKEILVDVRQYLDANC
jgi:hypothetical protein